VPPGSEGVQQHSGQHLQDFGKPAGTPERIALPVAGDDSAAKAKVSALIEDHGRRRRGTGDQRELHQHLIR